ncbi:hypothetical protein GLAREA_04626 [Glarea lozoyensis ATCC 20868]|uniref:Uncharacterized protein n=1 Tax=Glarea lozoyensis (strain ATCC 20868 / MF5171) TaxID=1116229 RepID=S3CQ71_GLAL2|nr:uncharacterized protein GLAREA_04626 [Glarea lozoyensis ATCC 20868]EPE27835.1 hypothetical protein GLAREA_04626 [Glarea lozoyensis ATCC 20868]
MDTSISFNDSEVKDGHLLVLQSLDAAYNKSVQSTNILFKDEAARRLRLRILLLEKENDELREQLILKDDHMHTLEGTNDELRVQIDSGKEAGERRDVDFKAQARELQNLRAEVSSMNSVAKENTKLLTEKLSLDRELAALKPEVEHLKSQAIHQQNVLSEKLALQRQIITLEVELETEKRAAQRTARRNADAGKDAEYESRLNRLKKDHAKERKEAARSQTDSENESKLQLEDVMKQLSQEKQQAAKVAKEYEKELKQSQLRYMHAEQKIGEMLETAKSTDRSGLDAVDFKARYKALEDKLERMNEANKVTKELGKKVQACDVRNASLEDKLDQMRTRLRSMKDQLKHAQEEANRLRAKPQDEEEPRTSLPTMKQSRKRAASEIFTENNVGTPERVPRAKRLATYKGRPDQVLVGEKSMFSITPFLNRTINMASDEFAVKENENQPEFTDIKGPKSRSPTQHAAMDPIRTSPLNENIKDTHTREKKVLAETKSITKNGKIRHAKVHSSSKLEDVTEEGDENEQEGEAEEKSIDGKQLMRETSPVNTKAANSRNVLGNQKHPVDVGPRIKKRKLLGGTLFDEEDGESTRKVKSSLGANKSSGKGLLSSKLKSRLAPATAFGGFSPLKKDRRGAGASFLV